MIHVIKANKELTIDESELDYYKSRGYEEIKQEKPKKRAAAKNADG